jgi:hypothetical protein
LLVIVTASTPEVLLIICELKANEPGLSNPTGIVPVPLSDTVCCVALPPLLSLITNDALRAPVPPGVNVRFSVQIELMGSTVTQLPAAAVTAKSAALVPLIDTPVTVNGALPLLVIVTASTPEVLLIICELKANEPGLSNPPGTIPVPLSVTVCCVALPPELSLITNDALRAPPPPGVKVKLSVQLELGDRVVVPVAQVPTELLTAKSLAFVPLRATPLMVNGAAPLLVIVNV